MILRNVPMILSGLLVLSMFLVVPPSSMAQAPDNDRFERTWARTDQPVADGTVTRTWIWGPSGHTDVFMEPYVDAPDGERLVQYIDKSRMEDNSYRAEAPWDVTNGLLARELITGRMQTGDDSFELRQPAHVQLAGDNHPDSPTYATFAGVLNYDPIPTGWTIIQTIDQAGSVGSDDSLAQYGVTAEHHVQDTNHTVASVFWSFMNSTGLIYVDGELLEDQLFENPFFGVGFPITEAYWVHVPVAGVNHDVLVQCFERRCLTYTPNNPEGWRVEAGNVGQHYYRWRYEQSGPPSPGEPVELECMVLEYPCSLADSSPEALDQIFDYGERMVEDMENGAGIGELLEWIRNQPSVVEATGNDEFIRFRVENGTPAWVYDSRIFGPDHDTSQGQQPQDPIVLAGGPEHVEANAEYQGVVGKDRDQDGFLDDVPKKARILAPYKWQFEPHESAPAIKGMLEQTRGYDQPGSVEYIANDTEGEENVLPSHFEGWDDFDVIYVSTHGGGDCDLDRLVVWECDTFLSTGMKLDRSLADAMDVMGSTPLFTGYMETSKGYLGLSNGFFFDRYGDGGIETSIIFLDSCNAFSWNASLPELLSGWDSIVFGWEGSVAAGRASESAQLVFSEAIANGTPLQKIYDGYLGSIINSDPGRATLKTAVGWEMEHGDAPDLRIRETVTLLHPITEQPLKDGDSIPIIGTPDDGNEDELPILLEVDGVDADPSEFIIHIRINDSDRPETFTLSDAELIGGGLGDLTGPAIYQLKDKTVSLGFDVGSEEIINVVAWVELPEGGRTNHKLELRLDSPVLTITSVVEFADQSVGHFQRAVAYADIPLVFTRDLSGFETGTFDLVLESYDLTLPQPCTAKTTQLSNGTIELVGSTFPVDPDTGKVASYVPENIVLLPNNDASATVAIDCPPPAGSGIAPDFGNDPWLLMFGVVHHPELNQGSGGFVFDDWEPGSGDIYATKEIRRDVEGGALKGETSLEVRRS